MSIWDTYPAGYRQAEVQRILSAVRSGACAAVTGLSGCGKSNLLGFIAHRMTAPGLPDFALVDCNRLPQPRAEAFWDLLASILTAPTSPPGDVFAVVEARLRAAPSGLCLLVDRLDALAGVELQAAAGNLRALRDRHKYALTLVAAMRQPLDPASELAELFFAHTIWLGALSPTDTRWSVARFAARAGLDWGEATLERVATLASGYPSLLRAVCEAHANDTPLEPGALVVHPAVQQRVGEIWSSRPNTADLTRAGLDGHPLLERWAAKPAQPILPGEDAGLTASEHRLLDYFCQHIGQLCDKDALIAAVWPAEVHAAGLRDDSLAQLVRRLRRKIELDPAQPERIQTVPGRGYRYMG